MAVSCPEVMYGAYYPYLYGRGAARSFHHATPFQYERFNVGSGAGGCGAGESYATGGGVALSSAGSASSGAHSPPSPPHAHHAHTPAAPGPAPPTPGAPQRLRAKEEELSAHGRASADGGGSSESEGECAEASGGGRGRAQYFSANCVVFTHYSGDVAAVVDEHFARALSCSEKSKESSPLSARNLPASFFDSTLCAGAGTGAGELYDYHHDPWHQHYQQYTAAAAHHHRAVQEYHAHAHAHAHAHHNMGGYGAVGGLLLGGARLPHAHAHAQYKGAVEWGGHQHASHHLDPAAYSYSAMPGLEGPVQDTSKDLYWF